MFIDVFDHLINLDKHISRLCQAQLHDSFKHIACNVTCLDIVLPHYTSETGAVLYEL